MPKAPPAQRYILLPPRSLLAGGIVPATPVVQSFFTSLENVRTSSAKVRALSEAKIKTKMRVIDSVQSNGAKLVEMSPDSVADLQAEQPGIRIVPVVYYYPAKAPRPKPAAAPKAATAALRINLTIVSKASGDPISGANVVAFTDFANRTGVEGTTDAKGVVSLALGSANKKVERLYVYSESGFWNALKQGITVKSGTKIELLPIDLLYRDCLRYFYADAAPTAGQGVTVGVLDTGVGPHRDLTVSGGENTVTGENAGDFTDNGEGHGTHVAGIIAARGGPPDGIRGVAPGVTLRSYRVFGKGAEGASNFAIAKAIDHAVADGCDLINMSLGGGPKDEATHSAIADARAKGSLVIVAAGNDGRQPVSFPASDSLTLAVSALGRQGTFPDDTTETGNVSPPPGKDKKNFIAEFSNVGPEILLTGPGVGIISTFPGNTFAVLDGTSMACPAVTGAAARLLSTQPDLLAQTRDASRSDAMAQAVLNAAKTLGFPATLEGRGLIGI
jgi:subtilisin family serine protease